MSSGSQSSGTATLSRVLIIDDNEDIAILLKDYLEPENIECKIFNGGLDGLDEIRKNNGYYNVVLLDLAMPDFSGLDVFNKLKEENLLISNNIIIITASSIQGSEFSDMIANGAKHVLKKPFTLEEIVDLVKSFTIKKDQ